MTSRSFGRAVPIHFDMLRLVGYVDEPLEQEDYAPAKTLNARKRSMRSGRHELKQHTGADFGYDPSAWREFLLGAGKEYGYKHPYAFARVDRAVLEAMADPDVIATLAELKSEEDSQGPN
jgi:hypothetical protein